MSKILIRTGAAVTALLLSGALSAQTLTLMDFNVRSFEVSNESGQTLIEDISDYIEFFRNQDPDIITLNEFENYTSRMGRDRMSEIASALDMYAYYIKSYPKDIGYYGNCILSKYPIVNASTKLISYQHYKGEGNYQWNSDEYTDEWGADQRSVGYVDILIPTSETENVIVRVACAHLDHLIFWDGKIRQCQEVVEFASLGNPPYPALLLGDMNESSGTPMAPIIEVGDWIWEQNLNLDHCFGFPKGKWTVESAENVNAGVLSDHHAIKVVVTLNK